jgi:uncharacterized membrane protein YedE/YeeE
MLRFIITLSFGFLFGAILIASQAFSWYRIQEMFHFRSFHMFGLLFSAIGTAALAIFLIKKFKVRSAYGNNLTIKPKPLEWKANIIGGIVFGLGWGISGACSAPVYILVGMHWQIGVSLLLGALIGTLIFGLIEHKLPRS